MGDKNIKDMIEEIKTRHALDNTRERLLNLQKEVYKEGFGNCQADSVIEILIEIVNHLKSK